MIEIVDPPPVESSNGHENRRSKKQRNIPRGRKRGFFEASNQTDQERRLIRLKERELLQGMKENATDLGRLNSSRFFETSQQLDEVYENVCYPREANLDASNLDELNTAVAKQSKTLGSSDLTKFDAADLIRTVRESCGVGNQLDWVTLGTAAGACFRSVPEINFLFGLMETEVIEKQKRTRTTRVRTQDDAEEARPSEYTSKKDRKDAQARRLEILQTTMERERKRHLFDLVMNPKSFTQTVENLFDTSFLVRNGAVEIALDEKGLPYVENHEGRTEETFPQQTQSIISITPDDWQAITKAWNMQENDEPLVGHRA